MKKAYTALIGLVCCIIALSACQSSPPEIPQSLSQAEFFQRAQEAADRYDWNTALAYYTTFTERFPMDTANICAAEYEIGFIYYKQKNYEQAKQKFQELLTRYEADNASALPQWPKVLAVKLLKTIDELLTNTSKNPGKK